MRGIKCYFTALMLVVVIVSGARQVVEASPYYNFEVVAKTGQAGLVSMGDGPSINDKGQVAFVGRTTNGDAIFYGTNGLSDPENITPLYVSSTRTFSQAVQINNNGLVVARDQVPGSPPYNLIRLWDINAPSDQTVIAEGGNSTFDYDAVYSFPAVNNNDQVVFSASGRHLQLAPSSCKNTDCLVTPTGNPVPALEFNEAVMTVPLKPMIADDGRIVVRAGNLPTDPIMLYDYNLGNVIAIASISTGFSELGQSPGISDDGRLVVFYGNLGSGWEQQYQTSSGPGIYASITSESGRDIQRIAGLSNGGSFYLSSFDANSRVSVNKTGTVSFVAFDSNGTKGIYTNLLGFIKSHPDRKPYSITRPPTLVVAKGESIAGVGTVQDLAVYDPLNNHNRGDITFWVNTDDGKQAIVRATPNCFGSNYAESERTRNPYINQYAAGELLDLPPSSQDVKGGASCGSSSFTMLLNDFKFSTDQTKRFDLIEIDKNTLNEDKDFTPGKAGKVLRGLGGYSYKIFPSGQDEKTVTALKNFIDGNLATGTPVLVSTSYSTKARVPSNNRFSAGHVILFTGRTLNGDYIVKDPAGDYYAGADDKKEHYGMDYCGDYVVYPKDDVRLNLSRPNRVNHEFNENDPRWAMAVSASANPDPEGLMVIGWFTGPVTRPYQLWIEDSAGRRTGWLANGTSIEEIPDSVANIEPFDRSDPDLGVEYTVYPSSWPYSASVDNADPNLRVFVYGNQDTEFSVEIVRYKAGGEMIRSIAKGTVQAGQTRQVDTSPPPPVTVPNVVNQTEASARAALTAVGLVASVTRAVSATVPAGSVISQNPAAGASVAAGSTVNLVVSAGAVPVTVPNVVGQTQASAVTALTDAGLNIGAIAGQSNPAVPAGQVIGQNPAAGAAVPGGSAVDLVVSSGLAAILVPNVVGQTQAGAASTLTGAGLRVGTVTSQNSATVPVGSVIGQNPAAGASVAAGGAVDLTVSSGPTAANLVVTNLNDSGPGSLRQMIATANAGGGNHTITFQTGLTGTITLTSGQLTLSSDLAINGPGADLLTISANKASRVFSVSANATVTLDGLTLQDGKSGGGGGGISNSGILIVNNCTIANNFGDSGAGGGIFNSGTLTVVNSILSGNTAIIYDGYGSSVGGGIANYGTANVINSVLAGNAFGGIYNNGGTMNVVNSTLSGNSGGGILNYGRLTVSNSALAGNTGNGYGGVTNFNTGNLTVTYSTIIGNSNIGIPGNGGGISNFGGILMVSHSTLANNSVEWGQGGGIFSTGTDYSSRLPALVTHSTLSGNLAGYSGGGIYNDRENTMLLNNCTLSGNSAVNQLSSNSTIGGGIYNVGTLRISNSTVTDNSADSTGGIVDVNTMVISNSLISGNRMLKPEYYAGHGREISNQSGLLTSPSQGHNLLGENGDSGIGGSPMALHPTDRILPGPVSEVIGLLDDNGGPTLTHLPVAGGLAVDAGDNSLVPDDLTTDQRGYARIQAGTVDIGPVELGELPPYRHALRVLKTPDPTGYNGDGTITSQPAGIDCGTVCAASFISGSRVTLRASPLNGATFAGWDGACSGTGACTVTISADLTVTAAFNGPTSHKLTVTRIGKGLVTSNPAGINCGATCSADFPVYGGSVTLTATPLSGATFVGWGGACAGTGNCTVTMDTARSVTAGFAFPNSNDVDGDGLPNTVDPDDDGDGLPDQWEQAHGFNPLNPLDAAQDPDDDGLNNGQEYRAGTDPGIKDATTCPGTDVVLVNLIYAAGQEVTCAATRSIRAGLPVTVSAGAKVTYTAPQVILLPGFTVQAGGQFWVGYAP